MMRSMKKGFSQVLLALFIVLGLTSCGASNSTLGTSATNCLVSLSAAMHGSHKGYRLAGVRLVRSAVARKYGFDVPPRRDVCLVGFVRVSEGREGPHMRLYAYAENSARSYGERQIWRHELRIGHFF